MTKKVIYIGTEEQHHVCSDPRNVLEEGKTYEIRQELYIGKVILYELQGVDGFFNSRWFKPVSQPTYFVLARSIPIDGEYMENYRKYNKGKWEEMLRSTKVLSVREIEVDTYDVQVEGAKYIVQLV